MKLSLLLAVLVCATVSVVRADEPTSTPQPNTAPSPILKDVTRDASPVAVPEPSEKAMRYYHSGNVLWCVGTLWWLLVPTLFLFTGFSARLRSWAERLGRKWYFAFAFYFVVFSVLCYLVNLPLNYYLGFVRQHSYDLSNQTFDKWLGDSLKGLSVTLVIGLAGWWIPFLLIKKSPRRWWLYASLLAVPFTCFMLLVRPVVIDPLFNKFQPLQDQALESKILALAGRAGIEGGRVYEVNKSVDTKTVNAYVNGFMGTKRIVFWDTALRTLNEDELLVVMGHEMGHYVLGHVFQRIVLGAIGTFLALYAAYRLVGRIIGRFKERFGFSTLSDFAALPLIILLSHLLSLAVTPAEMAFYRYQEHEADRFALELTHNNHAAATAFLKLQQHNLSNPRPGMVYTLWRSSHPSIGERIDFCNSYRPWETGEPSRYDKYIKQ
jgi:STE24 endopeptidase